PTMEDRIKASMLGERAALALISGVSNVVFGFDEGKVVSINLFDSVNNKKPLDPELVRLSSVLV
ncbi:MAG: ATP-dependent 6-phosphofructokinase, partial [Firmicutes bacterium]|nr:ATP-dependent 6-phosphofructokinase [Bacillota bacterium]